MSEKVVFILPIFMCYEARGLYKTAKSHLAMLIQGFGSQLLYRLFKDVSTRLKLYRKISPKSFIKFYFAANTSTILIKIKYIPNVMNIDA